MDTTEGKIGFVLLIVLLMLSLDFLKNKPSSRESDPSWFHEHYESIAAGIMAYIAYIIADLLAGAAFPEFMRDHLFDGLAPAAIIGAIINLYPSNNQTSAFPRFRRPVIVLLLMLVCGSVAFGLIAAAAIFSSGSNDYAQPIFTISLYGGAIFSYGYWDGVTDELKDEGKNFRLRVDWWFKAREPLESVKRRQPKKEEPVSALSTIIGILGFVLAVLSIVWMFIIH